MEYEPIKLDFGQKIGRALVDTFWVLIWLGVAVIGAGLGLAQWLGITGASWKFILGL